MTYNFQQPIDQKCHGVVFSKTNGTTITLTPTSNDGLANAAYIPVRYTPGGAGTNGQHTVKLTAALTCVTTTTGAGALDTGTIANNTGYYVYLICKENLADPALIMSASVPFPVGEYPPDYVMRSAPIFFIRYDAAVPDFIHTIDGWVAVDVADKLVNNGTATSDTAIDLTNHLPKNCYAKIRIRARHSATTDRNVTLKGEAVSGADTTLLGLYAIDGDAANQWDDIQQHIEIPVTSNLATSLYYIWNDTPAEGLIAWPIGFKLSVY